MEWKPSAYLDGNEYLTIGQSGFLKYDLSRQSGMPVEEIPYQQGEADNYAAVASDGEGGFFIANPKGIHHIAQGGQPMGDGGRWDVKFVEPAQRRYRQTVHRGGG